MVQIQSVFACNRTLLWMSQASAIAKKQVSTHVQGYRSLGTSLLACDALCGVARFPFQGFYGSWCLIA
jgi:hypothetical protein